MMFLPAAVLKRRKINIDIVHQNLLCFLCFSFRSLVDAVYALKDEVHELKKVSQFTNPVGVETFEHLVCVLLLNGATVLVDLFRGLQMWLNVFWGVFSNT